MNEEHTGVYETTPEKPPKLCPLLALGRGRAHWEEIPPAYLCQGAACAWWVVDGCAVVALAVNTS